MNDRALRVSQDDRVAQRRHRQGGLHPRVDGVADDLVGEAVLDRTQVQLPFPGAVFGDVGQPDLVGCSGGTVTLINYTAI
jgi:hypothetical protein